MTKTYALYYSRRVLKNFDGRMYDGCPSSLETKWGDWGLVQESKDYEALKDSLETYQRINPTRKYKIEE